MTMQALSDVLAERDSLRGWQSYVAEMAWAAAKAQYKEFPFPSYMEMTQMRHETQDRRTAEEIRDDLIARLNKEVNP